MGLHTCIGLGTLLSGMCAVGVWAWAGPYAGALVTAAAFPLGAMCCMLWQNQGRT